MPNGDPLAGFFYSTLILMIGSYIPLETIPKIILASVVCWTFCVIAI